MLVNKLPHLNGFRMFALGHTLAFEIQKQEFIQILHTGCGHWVAISTVRCPNGAVNVFDSLPPAYTNDLQLQRAAILFSSLPSINIRYGHALVSNVLFSFVCPRRYIDVHMQEGFADCGLFALANITTLAHGEQPGSVVYDQKLMRHHYLQNLEIRPFPSLEDAGAM